MDKLTTKFNKLNLITPLCTLFCFYVLDALSIFFQFIFKREAGILDLWRNSFEFWLTGFLIPVPQI